MMRTLRIGLFFGIACLAGLVTSEVIWRSPACRSAISRFLGRDQAEIAAENMRDAARDQAVTAESVAREVNLLGDQFGNAAAFAKAMQAAGVTEDLLRAGVAEHLRGRAWIERQIAASSSVTEEECRQFYAANVEQFTLPQRFRASHFFLAAPEGSPAEVIMLKEQSIEAFAALAGNGETIAALAAEASEDEATKRTGGDLGFFAAERMPPEFIAEVEKLRAGQISAPIRTHLGFHLVQLTDVKPRRVIAFEEARPEIAAQLANNKRAGAVAALGAQLSTAEFAGRR